MAKDTPVCDRISHLERQLRILGVVTSVLAIGLTITIWFAVRSGSVRADDSDKVLRVRGLVVEDANGRARILLGAPVPKVSDRKRTDDANGMILLGENGADRVAIGSPMPGPQAGGKVYPRLSPDHGIQLDDANGNERGGFGYSDNDRVMLGMDYPGREGLILAVMDGSAGITLNAASGPSGESAGLVVTKTGSSVLELKDMSGGERTALLVQDQFPARLFDIFAKDKSTDDVGVTWLNPQTSKHFVVKNAGYVMDEIEKLEP